jgi:hypothetical protein
MTAENSLIFGDLRQPSKIKSYFYRIMSAAENNSFLVFSAAADYP